MTIGGYTMKDRGFAIEVYEYEAGWSFLLQEMTRIISGRHGRQLKNTTYLLEHFLEITNTTRYSNNFFCWAICPAFFLSWARTIVRFI